MKTQSDCVAISALLVQNSWRVMEKALELATHQQTLTEAARVHAAAQQSANRYRDELARAISGEEPFNPELFSWLNTRASHQQRRCAALMLAVRSATEIVETHSLELAELRKAEEHLKAKVCELQRAEQSKRLSVEAQDATDLWSQRRISMEQS